VKKKRKTWGVGTFRREGRLSRKKKNKLTGKALHGQKRSQGRRLHFGD